MSSESPLLKLILQDLDENPDTWGTVLNVSAVQLLEDAVAGAASVVLASTADYPLDDTAGGPTASNGARYMVLNVTGSPGGATNIVVPTRSKVYLVNNQCGDSVVVKTTAGTGPTVIDGTAQWVFCDGTNVLAASVATAVNASTAALAADSTLFDGNAVSVFAQKAVSQSFTKGQIVARQPLTVTGAGPYNVTPDLTASNAFYHVTTNNFVLKSPSNAVDGGMFSLVIEQGGGAPHTISYDPNIFYFVGGQAPVLSTVSGNVDYFAFEYVTLAVGGRWVGSMLKGLSAP